MSPRPLLLLLLVGLLVSLPGCCMVGFGCCSLQIDLELSDDDTEAWSQPRVTVVAVLVANSEKDWVGPFEDRADLARWIADRDLTSDEATHKEALRFQGRIHEQELRVDERRGVVQTQAVLDPGDVEPFQGKLYVYANYRGEEPDGFVLEIPYTEACRYGVRLHASGELEEIRSAPGR